MAGDDTIDTTLKQPPADPGRPATVLFADVSESTKLYEAAGDKIAHAVIGGCLEAMRRAAEASGGRVVKTIGDELMVIFGLPDAAAAAAAEMQAAVDKMPIVAGNKLGLRIGFHGGPVIQKDNDVFGDTVNLAARLVATAVKGQIITSSDTARLLNPVIRSSMRELYRPPRIVASTSSGYSSGWPSATVSQPIRSCGLASNSTTRRGVWRRNRIVPAASTF